MEEVGELNSDTPKQVDLVAKVFVGEELAALDDFEEAVDGFEEVVEDFEGAVGVKVAPEEGVAVEDVVGVEAGEVVVNFEYVN